MKKVVRIALMPLMFGSLHIKAWTYNGVDDIPAQEGHVQIEAQQDPFHPYGVSARPSMTNYILGATALAAMGVNLWALLGQKDETLKAAIPLATLAVGIAGRRFFPSPRATILNNMRWNYFLQDDGVYSAVLQLQAPNPEVNGTMLDERIVLYRESGNNWSYHQYSKLNELKPQYYTNAAATGLCLGVGSAVVAFAGKRLLES